MYLPIDGLYFRTHAACTRSELNPFDPIFQPGRDSQAIRIGASCLTQKVISPIFFIP